MSLATSCPSCGTVFKVVEDQLKVSEGWVRCGHCHDVFNALEGLFDLERRDSMMQGLRTLPGGLDAAEPSSGADRPVLAAVAPAIAATPVPTPAPQPAPLKPTAELRPAAPPPPLGKAPVTVAPPPPVAARVEPSDPAVPAGTVAPVESAGPTSTAPTPPEADPEPEATPKTADVGTGEPSPDVAGSTPAPAPQQPTPAPLRVQQATELPVVASEPFVQRRPPQVDSETAVEEPASGADVATQASTSSADEEPASDLAPFAGLSTTAATEEALIASTLAASHQPDELPAFVRDAERRARWDRPWVRTALTLAVMAGAALLTGQVAVHHRDRIAAQCDDCRIPLVTLSAWLGLSVRPPVMLEAVEVDNAVLTHPPGADGYRLTVQVRNHSPHEVSAPHMELSLTDASGALLIRRVFAPQDFQQPTTLSAQAENSWNLEFQTSQKRVTGYTVAAFYP